MDPSDKHGAPPAMAVCDGDGSAKNEELSEFIPLSLSIKEIRDAIPPHLFERSTARGLVYLARDLVFAATVWKLGTYIDPLGHYLHATRVPPLTVEILRWSLWCTYWWFQGLIFTGLWVLGHECGHGAFSPSKHLCDAVGFVLHSLLWTPYFSWKISHHRHHMHHGSMERDEVYVPKTRADLGIPVGQSIDWEEHFGDTPLYTLFTLVRQQLLAFPAYLLCNVSGQKNYPKWTNHFTPSSILFTPTQASLVHLSNLGLLLALLTVVVSSRAYGIAAVVKFYFIPWLFVSHWFIMITYLHHTARSLPHYRQGAWTFARGAASTVDREFLGWMGRFFLHGVARWHVVHHFCPGLPWYNAEEATEHLQKILGPYYAYSDEPVFLALWRSYNDCQFVEDEGQVLFYKDKKGQAILRATSSSS